MNKIECLGFFFILLNKCVVLSIIEVLEVLFMVLLLMLFFFIVFVKLMWFECVEKIMYLFFRVGFEFFSIFIMLGLFIIL